MCFHLNSNMTSAMSIQQKNNSEIMKLYYPKAILYIYIYMYIYIYIIYIYIYTYIYIYYYDLVDKTVIQLFKHNHSFHTRHITFLNTQQIFTQVSYIIRRQLVLMNVCVLKDMIYL